MQTDTVTRLEIVERVQEAFADGRGADRSEILAAATAAHARPEVIELLGTLPERPYARANHLWEELRHVPLA